MVEDETSGTGTVTPSRNDWISAVEIDDGKLINPNVHAPKAISMFRNPYGYCVCVCVSSTGGRRSRLDSGIHL